MPVGLKSSGPMYRLRTCSGGNNVKRRRPLTTQAMLFDSSTCAGVVIALPSQIRGATDSSSSGIG